MVIDEPAWPLNSHNRPDQGAKVLPEKASGTSAENPWPLRLLSENMAGYLARAPHTWIEGQLTAFKVVGSGIAYMTMRDLDEDVSFNMLSWRPVTMSLGPSIQEGARVVALVKPNLYKKDGRLSMVVSQMRPAGMGDLLARIEQLRRTLAAEGLFAEHRKKPIPLLPQRIGLITGKDSDAEKDVQRNVLLRWPAAQFEVIHSTVQGADAPAQIISALRALDAHPVVDVIIIARGGGSLEDVILPFSDESLVRAVADAQTPVISAIGHEADRPIVDDVADLRASTPTDAAKRVVPDAQVEFDSLHEARTRMLNAVNRRLDNELQGLAAVLSRPSMTNPYWMVTEREEDLHRSITRKRTAIKTLLAQGSQFIEQIRARVISLSPQRTLDRGYAVVQHDRKIVRDVADLSPQDALEILVSTGRVSARVENTTPTDHP